jgi:hypothetical protein
LRAVAGKLKAGMSGFSVQAKDQWVEARLENFESNCLDVLFNESLDAMNFDF